MITSGAAFHLAQTVVKVLEAVHALCRDDVLWERVPGLDHTARERVQPLLDTLRWRLNQSLIVRTTGRPYGPLRWKNLIFLSYLYYILFVRKKPRATERGPPVSQ